MRHERAIGQREAACEAAQLAVVGDLQRAELAGEVDVAAVGR